MTKPYKEGKTWSFRVRRGGESIYRCGFATDALARKALQEVIASLTRSAGKPSGDGPWRTTLAQALYNFGIERLPTLKGARQEVNRINRYLRCSGLPTLRVTPMVKEQQADRVGSILWTVETVPVRVPRKIPQGLAAHRQALVTRTVKSDVQRKVLALTTMAEVQSHGIQKFVDNLCQDGYAAASVGLERALLRRLFAYAKQAWNWPEPRSNPAQGLKLPKVQNARDRVLTNKEWAAISSALDVGKNPYVAPALALLLETSMRSSETLVTATWGDWDRKRNVLRLTDAKAGPRDVPLSPHAVLILQQVEQIARTQGGKAPDPGQRILPITYEALKAAWKRACERAGITDIRLHDLRHTCATRFALEYSGNMPVLKIITGHKTDSQLLRYINIKSDDVVRLMHGRALDHDNAPAGLRLPAAPIPLEPVATSEPQPAALGNVIPFRRSALVA